MDRFVAAAPLRKRFAFVAGNDDATATVSHSRRVIHASFARTFRSLKSEGAGKAGCRLHPWVPCNKKHGGSTTGSTGITPAFPAQWF